MLLALRQFDGRSIALQTAHDDVRRLFAGLLRAQFPGIVLDETPGASGLYTVSLPRAANRQKVLATFGHTGAAHRLVPDNIGETDEAAGAFLRGVFLTSGSVIDPLKEYHFELVVPYFNLCGDLQRFVAEHGIDLRQTRRKGTYVLYLKESEHIEDMFTFMGAVKSTLELMNVKIYKDVRNKVNRVTNCETANITKTVAASSRQIEDIETIWRLRGREYLPPELRELAELRCENPELSLRELGDSLETPISRSGVNHRLQRLAEIAAELRGDKA